MCTRRVCIRTHNVHDDSHTHTHTHTHTRISDTIIVYTVAATVIIYIFTSAAT